MIESFCFNPQDLTNVHAQNWYTPFSKQTSFSNYFWGYKLINNLITLFLLNGASYLRKHISEIHLKNNLRNVFVY